MAGACILFIALCNNVGQVQAVKSPVCQRAERLCAVAVTCILRRNAASLLRAALAVKAVEQRLADALSVQTHGKVDGKLSCKVLARDLQEVFRKVFALPVPAVVVAPPFVALIVEAKRVVGFPILLRQRRKRQALTVYGGDRVQILQLIFHVKAELFAQLRRKILELRGTQPLVAGIVLAVDPAHAVHGKMPRKLLHGGRIHALVAVKRFFHMVDQRFTAALGKAKRKEPSVQLHAADAKTRLPGKPEHFFCKHQLALRARRVLGKYRLIIAPELLDERQILLPQHAKACVRVEPAELVDVVALSAVMPAGKVAQAVRLVKIVAPCAKVGHADMRIARKKLPRFFLRHNGDRQLPARFHTVVLDHAERRVLVAVRAGHGIVKAEPAVNAVFYHEAACGFGILRMQMSAPHELYAGAVFAQAIAAIFVIAAQLGKITLRDGFEGEHSFPFSF